MFVNSFTTVPAEIRIFKLATRNDVESLYRDIQRGKQFIVDNDGEKVAPHDVIFDAEEETIVKLLSSAFSSSARRLVMAGVGTYAAWNQNGRLFFANNWKYENEWAKLILPIELTQPIVINPSAPRNPEPNER